MPCPETRHPLPFRLFRLGIYEQMQQQKRMAAGMQMNPLQAGPI